MKLEIKDVKFFVAILKSFNSKNKITFKFSNETLEISAINNLRQYIILENIIFNYIDYRDIIFTIDHSLLLSYINHFKKNLCLYIDNNLNLTTKSENYSLFVKIPFIDLLDNEYKFVEDSKIKFILKPEQSKILAMFKGIVTYSLENMNLIIRREVEESNERIVINDIEIIESNYLYFKCLNNWANIFEELFGFIEGTLFSFNENILSIQFLFKKYQNTYLEIQIPRSL
ncbi:hypothetical protein CWI37_0508p0010 [Hamiltosporidium tvaerminnensis]|uniref:Proliferating cell nuclear antigen n=1 Tax=Hamiltosporidium tvaerminnensis TaxID=1176355 RepID=A0A4V2JV18_9MICR|nr:hypothetical protein CWI37_0982p0020 [Hamiltosporidium tvaerminnensis]TBU02322.1 hypothetical protein CWI37_0509p0020 [Hamiltosporidium tvaerminnensis]TBU02325.1 hypothetical protein CWI37_0508p0010 [Hamiltosporidium tvaerminnensis]